MELRVKPLGIIALLVFIAIIGVAIAQFSSRKGAADAEVQYDATKQASGELLFISSETKKDWLAPQVARFNKEQAGKITVKIEYIETRDAFQDIVAGKKTPALWAPSSTAWVGRLGDYWQKEKKFALMDTSDPSTYRLYLKTPMVFLTTQEKAVFLRPLLSQNGATWQNIHALSLGEKKTPWGSFQYSYADPLNAGSGFMALSMMVTAYEQMHPQAGPPEQVVKSPDFARFVQETNTAYVYDTPAFKGSSDLFKAFKAKPNRYDFICTYESNALKAAKDDPKLAVIYPNPTATVDMSIVLLSGAQWLSPHQKAAGKVFLQFLAGKEAMQAGVDTAFRTSAVVPGVSLDAELSQVAKQGFQTGITATELPPYDTVNDAAVVWRKVTRTSPEIVALMKSK